MTSAEILKSLGNRMRSLRQARGWSQEDLADHCGRHFTYIGRIERGEQNASVVVLHQIAEALRVPISALFEVGDKHKLLDDWGVTAIDIVEAISRGFRAQVDVKGKLAELMLYRQLLQLVEKNCIEGVQWLDEDGKPDFIVSNRGRELILECKNVRSPDKKRKSPEPIRVELQKTRNAMDGTPTRAYGCDHFHVLSACLFNRTRKWEFLHIASRDLESRKNDTSLLKVMQIVPKKAEGPWKLTIMEAMEDVEQ